MSPPKKKQRPAEPTPAEAALCNRIIGAAFETIMKKGYYDTSMLDIATRAKVSKRDLYSMYSNKQAVLVDCITMRAARMRLPPDLPEPTSRKALAATLVAYGTTVLREVTQPAVTAMYRLAVSEAERSPDVARALYVNRLASRDAIADLLMRAQASGVVRAGDARSMTEQYFALLWGDLLVDRLMGGDMPKQTEVDGRAHAAVDLFLTLYRA